MKLDLGCGEFKKLGCIGIDNYESKNIDITLNLDDKNIKLPFDDNSIDEIYAIHFLEHITHLIPLMNECYRILKPNGLFNIEVPLFPTTGAIKDPTHVRYFILESFDYFDIDWMYPNQPQYGISKYRITEKGIWGTDSDYLAIKAILQKI